MRAATYQGAILRARNVREGIKGDHWWRKDLDVESAYRTAIENREANLNLLEKIDDDIPVRWLEKRGRR